jgi:hypothetical protein
MNRGSWLSQEAAVVSERQPSLEIMIALASCVSKDQTPAVEHPAQSTVQKIPQATIERQLCQICNAHATLAKSVVAIILVSTVVSLIALILLAEHLSSEFEVLSHELPRNDNTKLAIVMITIPSLCFWSIVVVAESLVVALRSRERNVRQVKLRTG